MTQPITAYLTQLRQLLATGAATEHTHRPALAVLLQTYPGIRAINEPTHIACGAPDFAVLKDNFLVGHIEAKDIGADLNAIERTPQLKRYLDALPNLILSDYLEFRLYVDGAHRETARLATFDRNNKLKSTADDVQAVDALLAHFLAHTPQPIATPRELAERMAHLAHLIRDTIVAAFETGHASNLLRGWRKAFADVLVADLDQPEKTGEFADMVAQTLAYGLFSARVASPPSPPLQRLERGLGGEVFTRAEAQGLVPRTNPFLRKFFSQITGIELEDEPYAGFVEDLVQVLAQADMGTILADFGRRTRQQDPTVHFYETFLAAYDPRLRAARGVYYTPDPVVSFIVRSVDHLLKTRFDLPQGLADTSKVTVKNSDPSLRVKGKDAQVRKTTEVHKVLILDPATGTATFPYAIIDHIRAQFMAQGNAGMWSGYVREHLLPRIFGFELLMAPYAVAHFKLALQLAGHDLDPELRERWAYDFGSDERIGIYLTNALEGPHEHTGLPLFTQFLADESAAANEIKRDLPIMVVLGNPPYSGHSSNKGPWIDGLLKGQLPDGAKVRSYYEVDGQPLGERNPKWLQDDYVKFIRFGQWRIEQSGGGILAYISNNGYLDNPTFRGMRQSLMKTFTGIYILDLHGSARKKETTPDGSPDENVFDIMQGISIGLFVKEPDKPGPAQVYHADVWGKREDKYRLLGDLDVESVSWETIIPQKPFYLFAPQDVDLLAEYQKGYKVTDALPVNVLGFQTHRDGFAIAFERAGIEERIAMMRDEHVSDDEFRARFGVQDGSAWKLAEARSAVKSNPDWQKSIIQCAYRPFDVRWCYFSPAIVDRPRRELVDHVMGKHNLCLNTVRQTKSSEWQHAIISTAPAPAVFVEIKDGSNVFPLYLYPDETATTLFNTTSLSPWPPDPDHGNRVPNLSPEFVHAVEEKLGLPFTPIQPSAVGDQPSAGFGPEDVLAYSYAVFHSPTYRERYAEFLKIDFPRVPLTSDVALFWRLAVFGRELIALHLLESPTVARPITSYPIPGNDEVLKRDGYPKYTPPNPAQGIGGRVHINKSQYFEGVPEDVWEFQIGGYQVLDKWLKDRRGRLLTFDDLLHYQKVIVALQETMRLMDEIDAAIPEWSMT